MSEGMKNIVLMVNPDLGGQDRDARVMIMGLVEGSVSRATANHTSLIFQSSKRIYQTSGDRGFPLIEGGSRTVVSKTT